MPKGDMDSIAATHYRYPGAAAPVRCDAPPCRYRREAGVTANPGKRPAQAAPQRRLRCRVQIVGAQAHFPGLSIAACSEFTLPLPAGLDLAKLACQAVFVISFYDLSRSGTRHRSMLHGRFPHRIIFRLRDSLSTSPKGPARNLRVQHHRSY